MSMAPMVSASGRDLHLKLFAGYSNLIPREPRKKTPYYLLLSIEFWLVNIKILIMVYCNAYIPA